MQKELKVLVAQALPEEYTDTPLPLAKVEHIYTGVGKVNAALRLTVAIQRLRPDVVLNVGTAGTTKHHVGDILLCTRFMDRDLRPLAGFGVTWQQDTARGLEHLPWAWGLPVDGLCNTGDSFVTDANETDGDVAASDAWLGHVHSTGPNRVLSCGGLEGTHCAYFLRERSQLDRFL